MMLALLLAALVSDASAAPKPKKVAEPLTQAQVDEVKKNAEKAFADLDAEDGKGAPKAKPAPEPSPAPAPKTETAPPVAKPEPPAAPAAPAAPADAGAAPGTPVETPNWDFESGNVLGWVREGSAFDYQPTYGDNPTERQRGQASKHQGDFWIGTFEKRQTKADPAGGVQGDAPTGRLTSAPFKIEKPGLSFLIGGGCDPKLVRVELLVDDKVVRQATGKCSETMERSLWSVSELIGKTARVRLVDDSAGGWGHVNFDDLRFEQAAP